MSRSNGEPEWLPQDAEGTDWRFVSYKGRHLGRVVLFHGEGALAEKFCCHKPRHFFTLWEAANYVETTIRCTECQLSCLVSASN